MGGSGCGGEGRDQSERQSTVRGRCGPVVGVKIGGRSVEISTEVLEGIVLNECNVWGYRDSVEIGGEGFTLYYFSSSLTVVLSLCFPMHTHTHALYTVYTNSLFFLLSPSIHPLL